MNVQGKTWGRTAELFSRNNVELHRIEVLRGGYCSKHKHARKFNLFHVESGALEITVWQPDGTADRTKIVAGQSCTVPPGAYHRFEAVTDAVALEVYWMELDPGDIVRADPGGLSRPQSCIAAAGPVGPERRESS